MLPQTLAICRLPAGSPVPDWALQGKFFSATRTADELSIVCEEPRVPEGVPAEQNWVALKLEGPFPFSLTGVLTSFIEPLAGSNISVFALATFDTDYVLIKRENLQPALLALQDAGHQMLS